MSSEITISACAKTHRSIHMRSCVISLRQIWFKISGPFDTTLPFKHQINEQAARYPNNYATERYLQTTSRIEWREKATNIL